MCTPKPLQVITGRRTFLVPQPAGFGLRDRMRPFFNTRTRPGEPPKTKAAGPLPRQDPDCRHRPTKLSRPGLQRPPPPNTDNPPALPRQSSSSTASQPARTSTATFFPRLARPTAPSRSTCRSRDPKTGSLDFLWSLSLGSVFSQARWPTTPTCSPRKRTNDSGPQIARSAVSGLAR